MPQLDLVTFPSQVFWLSIFFIIFYAFVSGHFVPLTHKIIQTRSKKIEMSQDLASGQSEAEASALSESEGLVVASLDKATAGLVSCSEEVNQIQSSALTSGAEAQSSSLSNTVSAIQSRYLVSRGLFLFQRLFFGFKLFCLFLIYMVSYNESILHVEADVMGLDFLFLLPEVFLTLAVSAVLLFGACVYKPSSTGHTPIFRDVVSSLSVYTAFLTLIVLLASPYTQTGVSKNLF
jgi:hypothetical protein